MESTRRTSTVRQLELLVEFCELHKDLALGRLRSKEARELSKRLWRQCADDLNSEGPARLPKEWAKVWNDLKSRVRAKLTSINLSHRGTGGGPLIPVTLSSLEGRVADVIGRDIGPLPNVAQNPFQGSNEDASAPSHASAIIEVQDFQVLPIEVEPQPGTSANSRPYLSPPQRTDQPGGGSDNARPHISPLRRQPSPLAPSTPPPPPSSQQFRGTATASHPASGSSTPGRRRRGRRGWRPQPRVQPQAQTNRGALDESRAMIMRIEELRAQADRSNAEASLRQAEAAKIQAEAAKTQSEAAIILANAEKAKAEVMAALVPSLCSFLRSFQKRTRRISSSSSSQDENTE